MASTSGLLICLFSNLLFQNVKCQTTYDFPEISELDANLLEVYNGNHFVGMATYTNSTFQLPTLLVLYKRSCKARAETLGLLLGPGFPNTLPPPTYLTYATHNYEKWEKEAWFQYSEAQDLATLYDITSCPTEGGSSSKSEPNPYWIERHELPF